MGRTYVDMKISDLPDVIREVAAKDLFDMKSDIEVVEDMIWNKRLEDLDCDTIFEIQRRVTNAHWLINESARTMRNFVKNIK